MILTDEAIVLHSRRFGDSSRIVVLYTRTLGKISVVAKGVRTQKSNLSGALEPLSHSRVTVYHKKNRDLHTVTSAEVATSRGVLTHSYEHLGVGLNVAEIILRTQVDEEPNEPVFHLLRNALETLDSCANEECYGIGLSMRLALADLMGFAIMAGDSPQGVEVRLSVTALSTIHIALNSASDMLYSKNPIEKGRVPLVDDTSLKLELESFLQLYFSFHLDRRISTRSSDILLL